MSTSRSSEIRAEKIKVTSANLIVYLVDGRKLEVPLAWFPRLCKATLAQRNQYQLIGHGIGIHWPKADEDISVEGLLSMSKDTLAFQNERKQTRYAA